MGLAHPYMAPEVTLIVQPCGMTAWVGGSLPTMWVECMYVKKAVGDGKGDLEGGVCMCECVGGCLTAQSYTRLLKKYTLWNSVGHTPKLVWIELQPKCIPFPMRFHCFAYYHLHNKK